MAITDISISCLQSKLKLKQVSWFYSHPGHCSLGEISRHLAWHLPQVFAYYLLLTTISLHFYRCYTMTEYAFFTEKADRWGKDMASLGGNLCISSHLYQLELPCHSQAELFSVSSLKVWGMYKNPATTLLTCWFG